MSQKRELSPLEQKINNWVNVHLTRISLIDKIFFIDHLQTMLHAGLSLTESLAILEKETENKKFKITIEQVRAEVEQGKQLSEALAPHTKLFDSMYVKMIASGEAAGTLEESLGHIVTQMKKQQTLNSSVKGAMIYPSIIILAIIVVGILMTTVVLPKLITLFDQFGSDLPIATKVLVAITKFMSNPINVAIMFLVLIGIIVVFIVFLKKSPGFKKAIHSLNLKLPIIGKVIQHINLARFSLTLSSLLKSTIPIIDAVDISAETCSNVLFKNTLHETATRLKKGEPMSQVLNSYEKLYPPMVTEMIMVGERTGEVDRLLSELAEFYSTEVDRTMKNFSTVIEPIIIIILGLVVAGVAVAVIMPMFTLIQNF